MIDINENSMFICGSKTTATGQIIQMVKYDSLSIEFKDCRLTNILLRIIRYHGQCIKTALLTKQITLLPNENDTNILVDMVKAIIDLYRIESYPLKFTINIKSTFIKFKGRYYLDHRLNSPNVNLEYQLLESM
jgi:hypothetical protein